MSVRLLICPLYLLTALVTRAVEVTAPVETEVGFVGLSSLSYEEAKEVAAPFLSAHGRVSFLSSRNLLVVHDLPANIAAIRKVLKEVDTPPANIRVEVRFAGGYESSQSEIGLRSGSVSVEKSDGHTRVRAAAEIVGMASERHGSDDTTQFVLAGNGRPARIWVGQTVADPIWVYDHGVKQGWWREDMSCTDLGASLWVRPRILPDGTIEIELYPRLTARGERARSIDVKELSTKVVVADGQTVGIGGLDQSRRDVYRRLLGTGRVFDGRNLNITLTPRIQAARPPAGQPAQAR